jgi:hypothetical protein
MDDQLKRWTTTVPTAVANLPPWARDAAHFDEAMGRASTALRTAPFLELLRIAARGRRNDGIRLLFAELVDALIAADTPDIFNRSPPPRWLRHLEIASRVVMAVQARAVDVVAANLARRETSGAALGTDTVQ